MTAPTCGERTWVTPDDLVTCDHNRQHKGKHAGNVPGDVDWRVEWSDPSCRLVILRESANAMEYQLSPDQARGVRDRIQAQLDALDPDAAIAEAESAWLAALERAATLDAMMMDRVSEENSASPLARALFAAVKRAEERAEQAEAAWLALVEARDAKGGGA